MTIVRVNCVCGGRPEIQRPENAGYPWSTQCPLCGRGLAVYERSLELIEDAIFREEWTKRQILHDAAQEREAVAKNKAEKEWASMLAERAIVEQQEAERRAVLNARLDEMSGLLGRKIYLEDLVYLLVKEHGKSRPDVARELGLSRQKVHQIISDYEMKMAMRNKRLRRRAHLAGLIEPTPGQRDVWHECRLEDAVMAMSR